MAVSPGSSEISHSYREMLVTSDLLADIFGRGLQFDDI